MTLDRSYLPSYSVPHHCGFNLPHPPVDFAGEGGKFRRLCTADWLTTERTSPHIKQASLILLCNSLIAILIFLVLISLVLCAPSLSPSFLPSFSFPLPFPLPWPYPDTGAGEMDSGSAEVGVEARTSTIHSYHTFLSSVCRHMLTTSSEAEGA